jgi:hypothetical protein
MVVSALAMVALSAAIFATLKFLFWINAVICLGLMDRNVPRTYWTWTPIEVLLSVVASICSSAGQWYCGSTGGYSRVRSASRL